MLSVATERRSAQAVPALHTSLGFMAFDLGTIEGHDGADLLWQRIWLRLICAGSLSFSKIDCISRYRALGYKTVPIAADDRHKADLGFDIAAYLYFRSDCGSYQWPATADTWNRRNLNPRGPYLDAPPTPDTRSPLDQRDRRNNWPQ